MEPPACGATHTLSYRLNGKMPRLLPGSRIESEAVAVVITSRRRTSATRIPWKCDDLHAHRPSCLRAPAHAPGGVPSARHLDDALAGR